MPAGKQDFEPGGAPRDSQPSRWSERRHGKDPVPAILTTLTTTGRGIVINALSVIVGFSAMFASAFMPVKFFGFLVVVSIGTCLVGALVLLPALSLLLKPRFLEPERSGS